MVQKRKNNDYKPSDERLTHVEEVLQFMSVMTHDSRFTECYVPEMKERSDWTMCEVLDRIIAEGEARGEAIGAENKARTTSVSLSRFGIAVEIIAESVGYPINVVRQWISEGADYTIDRASR